MTRETKAPEERRAEILSAARALFEERGAEETSVSDIVQAAGVAQGTFYLYFTSKEAALEAVVAQITEEICTKVEDVTHDRNLGPHDKIERIREVLLETTNKDFIAYFNTKGDKRFHDELARGIARRLAPAVTEAIEQGVVDGVFVVDDPAEAATIILAAAAALHDETVWKDAAAQSRRADAYWEFVLRGLGCSDGKGAEDEEAG